MSEIYFAPEFEMFFFHNLKWELITSWWRVSVHKGDKKDETSLCKNIEALVKIFIIIQLYILLYLFHNHTH